MSKILLSSCDFRNGESAKCIYDNLPHLIGQCKVLYFPNEKATEEAIKSIKFYQRLSEFGFSKENIYIFGLTSTEVLNIYASGRSGSEKIYAENLVIKSSFLVSGRLWKTSLAFLL